MKKPKKVHKQVLVVSETCKNDLNNLCESAGECSEAPRLLCQCLEETDSMKQSSLLKKAGNLLGGTDLCKSHGKPPEWYCKCLHALGEVFLACDMKNPSRKTVSSIFDSLPQSCVNLAYNAVNSAVVNRMSLSMALIVQEKDVSSFKSDVEMISAMLDNFKLGTDVIIGCGSFALKFLGICLKRQRKAARAQLSPSLQTSFMLDCLFTIKTIISLLQKCSTEQIPSGHHNALENNDFTYENGCTWRQYLCGQQDPDPWKYLMKEMLSDLSLVLSDELFLADCRSAAGMAIPFLIRRICSATELIVSTMVKVLFCHHAKSEVNILPTSDDLKELAVACSFDSQGRLCFSHLCLCRGVLAMVPLQLLIQPSKILLGDEGRIGTLFFDVLFPDLCDLCDNLKEASETLAVFRTLALWTNQARQIASNRILEAPWIVSKLSGTSAIARKLLGFVWTNWNHPIEGVRYQTRTICEDVVQMHIAVAQSDLSRELFLKELSMSLFKVGWYVRGKYGPLCCITSVVGARRMLLWYPGIPQDVFTAMKDRGLVPHIMEFVEKIASCHKEEILGAEDNFDEWLKVWIVPVLEYVHNGSKQLRENLAQYCLPRLLKCCPNSLQFLLEHLQNDSESKSSSLRALVTCLKTARSQGFLEVQGKSDVKLHDKQSMWCGVVPVELMRMALCHLDDQIRLDAVALLCDSPRTTETITEVDLKLLQLFVPPNMNSQESSFRQQVRAHIKKFLMRLKECIRLASRVITDGGTQSDCTEKQAHCTRLSLYKEFLDWFCGVLFDSLYPGASFARRTTALSNLMLVKQIYSMEESNYSNKLTFTFADVMTRERVFVLLDSCRDTYDVNKTMALDLLLTAPPNQMPFQEKSSLDAWLRVVDRLVSSPRAVDSASAAVLLRLLIKKCSLPLTFVSLDSTKQQPEAADSGCPVSSLFPDESHVPCVQAFRTLNYLISLLRLHGTVALKNLSQAAVEAPMHGVLYCLRAIMGHIAYSDVSDDESWQKLVSVLLTECFQMADIVSPVVTSPSPEGHTTDDGQEDEGDWIQSSLDPDNMLEANHAMAPAAQILLVCCWRTMKEVALFLGELAENAPIRIGVTQSGLLTVNQFHRIGEFFRKILLTSKHRGAFELAYTGFVKLCSVLWGSPDASLRQLPGQWLQSLLQDINSAVPSEVLCGTRRSAGLPFFVQAIVTTEPFSAGKACFKKIMKELLRMASEPAKNTRINDSNLPQVHARNILRSLYRDTKLGEHVFPFVSEGVVTAVEGFRSDNWAVRNSSTLLFSALVTRIFGVKRSKDEHSRRNGMTGREFFSRFPELHSFLLDQLQVACQEIESKHNTHPSLYPVLVLLSRLYPSSMDGVDSVLNMAPFLPHVMSCSRSSVMKTRAMSAGAIVPLVSGDSLVQTLQQCILRLPSSHSEELKQNHIHGVLLQVQNLLNSHLYDVTASYPIKKQLVTDVLPQLNRSSWLGTRSNLCPFTRSLFLDVVFKFVVDWSWLDYPVCEASELVSLARHHLQCLKQFFVNMAIRETLSRPAQDASVIIGQVFVKEVEAKICLKACEEWLVDSGGVKRSLSVLSAFESLHLPDATKPYPEAEVSGGDPGILDVSLAQHPGSTFRWFELMSNLLQSSEYEVRLAVLEFIVNHLSLGRDLYKLTCDERVEIDSSVFKGRVAELQNQLFSMAMETEHHPDCIVKVFEALYRLPGVLSFPKTLRTGQQTHVSQCWTFVVNLIVKPGQRDTLKCVLLDFLSLLVPLMDANSKNMDSAVASDALVSLGDISALTLHTSSPTESVDVRLTTATLLGQNALHHLLMDPHMILGGLPFQLWSVVINLLQDEDAFVRERMSQGFSNFMKSFKNPSHDTVFPEHSSVVAPVAMKLVMSCVWNLFIDKNPMACLQWMLGWICGDVRIYSNNGDVQAPLTTAQENNLTEVDRLFEKGSFNIYAEKCEVTTLAWKTLRAGIENSNGSAMLTLKEEDNLRLLEILDDVFETCLQEVESLRWRETALDGSVFECFYQSLVGILAISFLKEQLKMNEDESEFAVTNESLSDKGKGEHAYGDVRNCRTTTNASLRLRQIAAVLHEIENESRTGSSLFYPRLKRCVLELDCLQLRHAR